MPEAAGQHIFDSLGAPLRRGGELDRCGGREQVSDPVWVRCFLAPIRLGPPGSQDWFPQPRRALGRCNRCPSILLLPSTEPCIDPRASARGLAHPLKYQETRPSPTINPSPLSTPCCLSAVSPSSCVLTIAPAHQHRCHFAMLDAFRAGDDRLRPGLPRVGHGRPLDVQEDRDEAHRHVGENLER